MSCIGTNRLQADGVEIERDQVKAYIKQLFKRTDFPGDVFISLGDSILANKGDLVWMNIDPESPFDFVPIAGIDELVLNLPSKDDFLRQVGTGTLEQVSRDEEEAFWDGFQFKFADTVGDVSLSWV